MNEPATVLPLMPRRNPEWFTPLELADRWQISRSTIYRILPDELKYAMIGGQRRYRRADVEAYEQEMLVT